MNTTRSVWPSCGAVCLALLLAASARATGPKTICYSVQPNGYLDDHAAVVSKIYDGFFFTAGSWEQCAERVSGPGASAGPGSEWLNKVRKNLASLRGAGVTENFLTVHFSESGSWPTKEALLSEAFANSMAQRFGAIARAAAELGFRGLCIDIEYCYLRCDVTHPSYRYDDYTVGDLVAGARREGRQCMAAILDAFPEAVIIVLPGDPKARPLSRAFQLAMLDEMARRDAPGGLHFGTEYTYCLHDPLTAAVATRFVDPEIRLLGGAQVADYWKRRCSVAPGVWPLHMVETGGLDYPLQPWAQEVAELRQQMAILRTFAKRYVWAFSGQPSWYLPAPELERKYGLARQDLKRPDIDLRLWHEVLEKKPALPADSPWASLLDKVRQYDAGKLTGEALCDAFGTPGRWWVLGPVGNPHTQRHHSVLESLAEPVNPHLAYQGRDGTVRWFDYPNLDPRGVTSGSFLFAWRNTDNAAAHFVSFVHSPRRLNGYLHVGWDDGIVVRLGEQVVFDKAAYPPKGKGMLFRDKHQFESRVPIVIERGRSRLSVLSINSHGNWVFSLRITGPDDLPLEGVEFRLE